MSLALTCKVRGESGGYWKDNPQVTYEACSALRKRESSEAAKALGATIEFLDWDDYPLVIDAERTRYLTKEGSFRSGPRLFSPIGRSTPPTPTMQTQAMP